MSCTFTLGRIEPCKDQVGGLNKVYFINSISLSAVAYDTANTDVISQLATAAVSAYVYDLKGTSNFEQAITSSRDNGTTFFEQVLNIVLKKQTAESHKQIKLLAWARPIIVVEDNNGNAFLMGLEHGAEVTGGSIVTGAAYADLTGYNVTFTGQERVPANFLKGAIANDPFAGLSGTKPTMVFGA
jgi:hypothetical protein